MIKKIIKNMFKSFKQFESKESQEESYDLKKYPDNEDLSKVEWTKYKIIVPSEEDRQELMKAFEYFHYRDVDSSFVAVNQLIHEYLDESRNEGSRNNILVDPELYEKIKDDYGQTNS